MTDVKHVRLQSASNPRRATLDDAIPLSRMFASAFMDDPVFDYMVRSGEKRRAALETFFKAMLTARDIPQNEVWMSNDGSACVSWLPSGARRGPAGFEFSNGFLGLIEFFDLKDLVAQWPSKTRWRRTTRRSRTPIWLSSQFRRSFRVPVSDHSFSMQHFRKSMLPERLRTLKTAERETRFSINAPGLSRKVTSHQKARRRFLVVASPKLALFRLA
jgi:hypothetical protein